jgi:adenosine/AMP kinase
MRMDIQAVPLTIPEGCNLILGQTHFIKSVEDLYEIVVAAVPQARFGAAFSEASGPCLIRFDGNDQGLMDAAVENIKKLASGHSFCILLRDAYPINLLNAIKNCAEVCSIFCATANPVSAIVTALPQGNGILGVVDGEAPKGVEGDEDKKKRKEFLRMIGYKR